MCDSSLSDNNFRFADECPIELKMSEEVHIVVDNSTNYKDNEVRVVPDNTVIAKKKTGDIELISVGRTRNETGQSAHHFLLFRQSDNK